VKNVRIHSVPASRAAIEEREILMLTHK